MGLTAAALVPALRGIPGLSPIVFAADRYARIEMVRFAYVLRHPFAGPDFNGFIFVQFGFDCFPASDDWEFEGYLFPFAFSRMRVYLQEVRLHPCLTRGPSLVDVYPAIPPLF